MKKIAKLLIISLMLGCVYNANADIDVESNSSSNYALGYTPGGSSFRFRTTLEDLYDLLIDPVISAAIYGLPNIPFVVSSAINHSYDLVVKETAAATEGFFASIKFNKNKIDTSDNFRHDFNTISCLIGTGRQLSETTYLGVSAAFGGFNHDFKGSYIGLNLMLNQALYEGLSLQAGINGGSFKLGESASDIDAVPYGGAFARLNQELKFDEGDLNFYVAYLFDRTQSFTGKLGLAGIPIRLDAVKSHRAKIGGSAQLTNYKITPFIHVSFEHEFKNEAGAKARIKLTADSDSFYEYEHHVNLKNKNLVMVELGINMSLDKHFNGRLSAEKYFGSNQGFGAALSVSYQQ